MTRWMTKALALLGLALACQAYALTAEEALGMAVGESDARIEALAKAVAQGDDKTAAYLQALADDAVKVAAGKVPGPSRTAVFTTTWLVSSGPSGWSTIIGSFSSPLSNA